MKRSLFFCAVGLLAGIYTSYFVPDAIPVLWMCFLALVLLVLFCFSKRGSVPFGAVLFFLLGAVYLQQVNDVTKRPLFPYMNEYVTVEANVVEEPAYNENTGIYSVTAVVQKLSFMEEEKTINEKVLLSWPADEKPPAFGKCFRAVCLFYEPAGSMNRGGFDYGLYLKTKNIFFKGSVEAETAIDCGNFPLSFKERIYAFNRRCGAVITKRMPKEASAVFRAVSLGDKTQMSKELKDLLQISGLSHVTAVSGMHVTALVSLLYALFKLLKQNKYKYILPVGSILLLFMLFTGMTPSVIRATVMGVLMLLAPLFYKRADSLTSLAVAASLVVLWNPLIALDAGFMLSFGATLGILLFADGIDKTLLSALKLEAGETVWHSLARGAVSVTAVSFGAQVFMLPLSSWIFGYVSLWSMVSSSLITLLAPVLLICGLLMGLLGLLHPALALLPAYFGYPFMKVFLAVVYFFGQRPAGLMTVGSFSFFGIYVYGLALFLLHSLLHKRFRMCMVPAISLPILISIYLIVAGISGETVRLTFINVGQGDCSLLELPDDVNILIDGGGLPAYQKGYDVGEQIVLPYLRKSGICKLDYVIASHPHEDHIDGLSAVVESVKVEKLLIGPDFEETEAGALLLEEAKKKDIVVERVSQGEVISFGRDSHIKVLSPGETLLQRTDEENELSLVLLFSYFNNEVLFTGDAEEQAEDLLVEQPMPQDGVEILKVGHHGSNTSSGAEFLNWSKPDFAFIPCGRNSFGHPHEEVLKRLQDSKTVVYRADREKDVTFILDKAGIRSIRKGGNMYDAD